MLTLPGVSSEMRTWEFWSDDTAELFDAVRSQDNIREGLDDLDLPSKERPPRAERDQVPCGFLQDGQPWSDATWSSVVSATEGALLDDKYGFTVTRANLRTWPTDFPCYRQSDDREFDQFQETRLHLFEAVRIGASTPDGEWYWVRSQIASGWIHRRDVAAATVAQWERYRKVDATNRLIISANGVATEPQPYDGAVSNQPVEYAAWLPLASGPVPESVGNQHSLGHYVVEFPVRQIDGTLAVRPALIKDDPRVGIGYLPCSRMSLAKSVFQLLGDRYAWGDLWGTHDCSSLIMDAYRTIGIQLPRNSSAQARYLRTIANWTAADEEPRRIADLTRARLGDVLTMPGHVLMFLGIHRGTAYAIHAFVGYGTTVNGQFHTVLVNSVEVSSLSMPTRGGPSYLQALSGIARVFS